LKRCTFLVVTSIVLLSVCRTDRLAPVREVPRGRVLDERHRRESRTRCDTQQRHLSRPIRDRHGHLGAVKAQRRRGVHVEVAVVHHMKAPKERHAMRPHVPEIERIVHQKNGKNRLDEGRKSKALDQPRPLPLHPARQRIDHRFLQEL
jgi:hypothetical protein